MSLSSKPLRAPLAAVALAVALAPAPAAASDHIDGLKTAIDNSADLTDLFAFTSPRDPSKVVLVLGVHAVASTQARFSDAVDYAIRVRPVADPKTLAPLADASRERSVVCRFSGGLPFLKAKQRASCTLALEGGTETLDFDTRGDAHRAGGEGRRGGTRIFAGVRSDPWFLDALKVLKVNAFLPLVKTPSVNGLWGQNVLAIVVELDKARLPGPLFAVTAQTVRR